jgi:hypothetical protein
MELIRRVHPNWWMLQDNENLGVDPSGRVEGNEREGGLTEAGREARTQLQTRDRNGAEDERKIVSREGRRRAMSDERQEAAVRTAVL